MHYALETGDLSNATILEFTLRTRIIRVKFAGGTLTIIPDSSP